MPAEKNGTEETPDSFEAALSLLLDQLGQVLSNPEAASHTVSRYVPAAELDARLNLSLGDEGSDASELLEALQSYMQYTPKTWAPEFSKLLFSGFNAPGILADWVTSVSNSTMHTYQVAPVACLMERELVRALNQRVGFNDGDGIMVSGGSMANMVAMLLARNRKAPHVREQGASGRPLVAYVSEQAHYSYEKAANILGIGTRNLVKIESDDRGRLCPQSLSHAIERSLSLNRLPFFIGLTAGTTVVGAFDTVAPASVLARKHDLWLHIDGAWGGPVLFSQKHRHLLPDTSLADSFTWDAHKLMNIPLIASLILVKDSQALRSACAGGGGDYLFHRDENAEYNSGDKSLQCGRRVDALKFWLSWKATGARGYARKIDRLMALKDCPGDARASIRQPVRNVAVQ